MRAKRQATEDQNRPFSKIALRTAVIATMGSPAGPTEQAPRIVYSFRLEDKSSRTRTTRFEFEFPNLVFVTSQYMPLSQ